MRELAVNILAGPNEKDLEVLDNYFDVALVQNWVSPSDILAIKKEYDNLREELKKGKSSADSEKKKDDPTDLEVPVEILPALPYYNSTRQEKILAFLKENGRAQVWQVKQILPEVTKRTLRRDFENMLKQGIIERVGEKNDTFYQIANLGGEA